MRTFLSALAAIGLAACETSDPGDKNPLSPHTTDTATGGTAPAVSNVLILLADDVGIDKISAYGRENSPVTPNIDALAASGVRFETAWIAPYCAPGRAMLETGRYGRRTGYGSNNGVQNNPAELHLGETTLAEVFKLGGPGRATSLVGKWHLSGYSSASGATHPLAQGYDWWSGNLGNLDDSPLELEDEGYYHWERFTQGESSVETTYATIVTTDDAIARVAAMSEPWLLEVAFNAAHEPYHVAPAELLPTPPPAANASAPDKYNAALVALDTEIGRLLASIPDDVRARTNIVFLGDNGTILTAITPPQDPDRGKGTMFDGGVQVPLIVSGPIVVDPGRVETTPVSAVDVWPTVAELAGADTSALTAVTDPGAPLAIDGVSLVPFLDHRRAPEPREAIYAEWFDSGDGPYTERDLATARNASYKVIRDWNKDDAYFFAYTPGAVDEGDPLDLADLTPDVVAELDGLLAWLEATRAGLTFDGEWVEATWPTTP